MFRYSFSQDPLSECYWEQLQLDEPEAVVACPMYCGIIVYNEATWFGKRKSGRDFEEPPAKKQKTDHVNLNE